MLNDDGPVKSQGRRRSRSSITLCVVVTNDVALAEALAAFNRPDRFIVVSCVAAHLPAFVESFSVTHVVVDLRHVPVAELQPMLKDVTSAAADSTDGVMSLVERLREERVRTLVR